ncbi:hypothetical protein C9426_14885 [Serratia sp. S1B]|nr:hypothetical protein C9426_14885 [Serratia sp. S1B]
MRTRRLDNNHDWVFGHGRGDYLEGSEAIAQSVTTRLLSLHNDWFLNREHGVKWFDYLKKNPHLIRMEAELKNTVLNTEGVTLITDFTISLDPDTRKMAVQVSYTDVYGENREVTTRAPGD